MNEDELQSTLGQGPHVPAIRSDAMALIVTGARGRRRRQTRLAVVTSVAAVAAVIALVTGGATLLGNHQAPAPGPIAPVGTTLVSTSTSSSHRSTEISHPSSHRSTQTSHPSSTSAPRPTATVVTATRAAPPVRTSGSTIHPAATGTTAGQRTTGPPGGTSTSAQHRATATTTAAPTRTSATSSATAAPPTIIHFSALGPDGKPASDVSVSEYSGSNPVTCFGGANYLAGGRNIYNCYPSAAVHGPACVGVPGGHEVWCVDNAITRTVSHVPVAAALPSSAANAAPAPFTLVLADGSICGSPFNGTMPTGQRTAYVCDIGNVVTNSTMGAAIDKTSAGWFVSVRKVAADNSTFVGPAQRVPVAKAYFLTNDASGPKP